MELEKNFASIAVLISVVALGMSIFNTYQIKNGAVVTTTNTLGVKAESPEKILKDLPANAPFLGSPDAKVVVVEFADFQCPFCGKFFTQSYPTLKKEYIDTGKIKFVFLDFAFLGQESLAAAEAAKCAGEQGKFWQYHDELFKNQNQENQGYFNDANLEKFAGKVGLNVGEFETCTSLNKYDQAIEAEKALAEKYGVSATPSFIIGKQVVKGLSNISNFRQIIDSELK